MKILHLSDIHYDVNNHVKFNELLEELKKCTNKIDLIVITGDLINRGKAGCDSIDKGFEIFDKEFICPILTHFNIERDYVILVPGNHDIDRTKINDVAEIGLQNFLLDDDKVSDIIKQGINNKTYQEFERLQSYKSYVEKFYQNSNKTKITLFHDTHILNIEGVQVGITSFNTAWRCYSSKSDEEKLILGVEQCLIAAEDIIDCDIKIALMHHELEFLQKSDYEKVEPWIRKKYDLLCFGHVHSSDCSCYCKPNGEVISIISPGFCVENMFTENNRYDIGFSIIDIDTENGLVDVEYYKWSQRNTEFMINPEIRFDTPKRLKSFNQKKNNYCSENMVLERTDISSYNIQFLNEKIGIKEIKLNQDNNILVESKGVFYSKIEEITNILEKNKDFKKIKNELEFILLYADKILLINNGLISKFENIFINKILYTDKVINIILFKEVIELLHEWIEILTKEKFNINILNECKQYGDFLGIDQMIDLINSKDKINEIIDEYTEKKKKEIIVISFILPILYISNNNIIYSESFYNNEDIGINNYFEREIEEVIYNSFLENKKTIIYGKVGNGKTTSIKKIKNMFDLHNNLNICIYFSFLHQTIQDNIKSFLEYCNSRLILKTINNLEIDTNIDDIYNQLLLKIFNNLILEYKNVYIIFDDINNTNLGLLNLFINIKNSCHCLFIIDDKEFDLYKQEKDIKVIYFPEFSVDELKKDLSIDSEVAASLSDVELDFDVINNLKNNSIDIKNYIQERKNYKNSLYFTTANKWMSISQRYQEEMLIFLSIFNKICPINIEHIQKYILTQDIHIKKPYIKQIIINHEEQLLHNNYSNIKFKDEDFVKYICIDYFSKYDLEVSLRNIFKWVGELDISDSSLIAFLVVNANKIVGVELNFLNDLQQSLNNVLLEKKDGKLLYSIGKTIFNEYIEERKTSFVFIEKASDNKCVEATEFLIDYYLRQSQKSYNIEIKKLINQAIELNSEKAKFAYVFGILEERFTDEEDTFDKVMEVLEDLSQNAKDDFTRNRSELLYCINTIKGLKSNITYDRAIEIIMNLSQKDTLAKVYYARYMIDTNNENKIREAESILIPLSENGLVLAKVELVKLYLSSKAGILNYGKAIALFQSINEYSNKEVEDIILEAYFNDKFNEKDREYISSYIKINLEKDIEEFKIIYSHVLMYGNKKYRNINEGKKSLRALVENDNVEAMYILGNYLIYNEPNNIDGIKLLENSAKNYVPAQLALAKVYLDTNSPYYDKNKGVHLYNNMINKGYVEAILEYSKYLLKCVTLNKSEKKDAESKLVYLSELGNIKAIKILSKIYLNKKYNMYDIVRGEYFLTLATKKGDTSSISNLAQRYLYGIDFKANLDKAVELLKIGIKMDDGFCMAILGKAILDRTVNNISEDKGKVLLLKAFELDDNLAKTYYGCFLCQGNFFEQNKEYGEKLLIEASKYYDEAKLMLSRMKLDGKYLEKNTEDGLNILLDAVDSGCEDAKIEYAERLIDGDQIECDTSKGLNLLKQLFKANSDKAKIIYAEKLLSQKFGEKETEARTILSELLDSNKTAKRRYAINLLEKKLEYDLEKVKRQDKAISMLNENIEEEDKLSIYTLGNYYLEGDKITKDITKGIELFEMGVNKEIIECLRELGNELLRGEIVEQNSARGTKLLYAAYKRGDLNAKYLYARYNIEGLFLDNPDINSGWTIMEELVEDNYFDAKIYMANAYIKGSYREKNVESGVYIYEKMIKEKNEIACISYSNILSNGLYMEIDLRKSQNVLKITLNKPEAYLAKYEKIQKMYAGKWTNNSIKKAARELRVLADSGSEKARFELAIRQITGFGIAKNEKKGNEALKSIIKDISAMSAFSLGMVAYRLKAYEIASNMFDIAIESQHYECRNALAYIMRKKQYTGSLSNYNIQDLLKPLCDAKYPIALINFALYLVEGETDDEKWMEADKLIKKIKYFDDCFEWWYELMIQGDDEGKLVVAWLLRNNIFFSLGELNIITLVKDIDRSIWKIPQWFC